MKEDIKKNLYEYIDHVNFEEAEKIFLQLSFEEQNNYIMEYAFERYSMVVFLFMQYINSRNENMNYYDCIVELLLYPLSHIEGAYEMAYYYVQKCLKMEPENIVFLKWLLSFYQLHMIDEGVAQKTTDKILILDPDNKYALSMNERLKNKKGEIAKDD